MGLFSSVNSYLGIDIGSTGAKIVELKKESNQAKLLTYGFSDSLNIHRKEWHNDIVFAAKVINKICDEAGVISRNAVSALPTYSVFSSVLNLSAVSKKDMASAVHWEAKKVIPLPLEEMILDWKKIEGEEGEDSQDNNIRVLLTGAPRTLVKKYIDIFKEAQINLLSLETETFSLIRSILGNDKSTVMLVEMGASTTDISIIDKSIPMLNRSIDVGGITITNAIGKHLNIGWERAEQFKYDLGISSINSQEDVVPKAIIETISPIVNEIKYAVNLFESKNSKKTEKIILSGGSALLPNLVNYLSKVLDMKVIIGDPWSRISYPVDLEPLLNEIGPYMSVAVGLAMREIE
jgi:type IV pilus assembly protein PilM